MKTFGFLGLGLLCGVPVAGGDLFSVAVQAQADSPAHVQRVELADGTQQVCEVRPGEVRVTWSSGSSAECSAGPAKAEIAGLPTTSELVAPAAVNLFTSKTARLPRWTGTANLTTGSHLPRAPFAGGASVARAPRSHGNRIGVARVPSSSGLTGLARPHGPHGGQTVRGRGEGDADVRFFTTRREDSARGSSLEGRVTDLERRVDALERELGTPSEAPRARTRTRVHGLKSGDRVPGVRVPAVKVPRIRVPRMELREVVVPELDIQEIDIPELVIPEIAGVHGGQRVIEWGEGEGDGRATIVWPDDDGSSDQDFPRVLHLRVPDGKTPRVLRFHTDEDGSTRVEVGDAAEQEGARDSGFEFHFDTDFEDEFEDAFEVFEGHFEESSSEPSSDSWVVHEPAQEAALGSDGFARADASPWTFFEGAESFDVSTGSADVSTGSADVSTGSFDVSTGSFDVSTGSADVEQLVDELRRQVEELRAGLGDLRHRIRAESGGPSTGGTDLGSSDRHGIRTTPSRLAVRDGRESS